MIGYKRRKTMKCVTICIIKRGKVIKKIKQEAIYGTRDNCKEFYRARN